MCLFHIEPTEGLQSNGLLEDSHHVVEESSFPVETNEGGPSLPSEDYTAAEQTKPPGTWASKLKVAVLLLIIRVIIFLLHRVLVGHILRLNLMDKQERQLVRLHLPLKPDFLIMWYALRNYVLLLYYCIYLYLL